jgi:hypothetical protein
LTEPKHEDTFKVVDRRLFSETGELRKDVAEQTEREQNAADAVAAKAKAAQPAAQAKSDNSSPATADSSSTNSSASAAIDAKPANRSFQMLVDFIARNAAMLLGGYTDPRTGQPLLDLDGAREVIDMLDALRETTRGNLGAEDDKLLLDVIGSLKLSYMEISKAAAAASLKEKAKTHP